MPALALAIDLNEDCGINDRFISERGRSKTEWRPLSSVKCMLLFIVKLIRRIDKEKIIEYTTMSDKVNEFAVSLFMRLWVEMQQV